MSQTVELSVRLGCFLGVFFVMTLWELFAPRRSLTARRLPRWSSNLAIVGLNTVLVRLILPVTAVAAAMTAKSLGWGVLQLVVWPNWIKFLLAVVALDLAIYLQHVMFHAVPLFWRLHLVHHADLDFDVTTGLRFHTLEILLSAVIKICAVLFLGPPPLAVVVFEVLLNATSMFNHSNVSLPGWCDRLLRCFIVTPDMHRVHHSTIPRETNSNFGFNLPWWDFLLGTYRAQPAAGHLKMTIGLDEIREERVADRLHWMLLLPFWPKASNAPHNQHGNHTST